MSLFPLNQEYLSNNQRHNEDEHHLGVHGLVPAMLLVQLLMLDTPSFLIGQLRQIYRLNE